MKGHLSLGMCRVTITMCKPVHMCAVRGLTHDRCNSESWLDSSYVLTLDQKEQRTDRIFLGENIDATICPT